MVTPAIKAAFLLLLQDFCFSQLSTNNSDICKLPVGRIQVLSYFITING